MNRAAIPTRPQLARKPGEYQPSWAMVLRHATPPMLNGSNMLGTEIRGEPNPSHSRRAFGLTDHAAAIRVNTVPDGFWPVKRKA